MSLPSSWVDRDLEKGDSNPSDLDEKVTSPTEGGTTLADDRSEPPESPSKPRVSRQWTDRVKQTIRRPTWPEKLRTAKYDENLESIQRIDFHPHGYPRLAAYINSDENLIRLDAEDKDENPSCLQSRKLDDAQEGSYRRGLIQQIDDKLKEYDELVMRCGSLASLKRTTSRNYKSLANWMYNEKPLSAEESEFINSDEDFIALCESEESSWFDGLIEDGLSKIPCKLTRLLFTSSAQRRKSDDPYTRYYSKSRIGIFARLIVCLLAVGLLIAPVALLFTVAESNPLKVLVVVCFTLFFCSCISLFTKAKRHELFAATAASVPRFPTFQSLPSLDQKVNV
ncbi:MAG: hypothetical protein Q9160_003015 [Pyrenula sp. 1 TL-2023]